MELTTRIRIDISNVLRQIQDGSVDRISIKSLLIDLRDYLPTSSKLTEISHFIAHPTSRTKGSVHKSVLETFVQPVMDFYVYKCTSKVLMEIRPLYEQQDIIDELIHFLKYFHFSFDEEIMRMRGDDIMYRILQLEQGVPLKYVLPKLDGCYLGDICTEDGKAALPVTMKVKIDGLDREISYAIMTSNKRLIPTQERHGVGIIEDPYE